MKRLSLLLALLCLTSQARADGVPVWVFSESSRPSGLQNQCSGAPSIYVQGGGCSLLSSTTPDATVLQINGSTWASVKIAFAATTSPPQLTVAYSIDGGFNYLNSGSGAPYLKRLDAVTANPTVQAFVSIATATAQSWELPLAANVTHVKVFVAVTGTNAQTVTISGQQAYSPNMPVLAVLYDVTSATNTANDTGIFDMSGWTTLLAFLQVASGPGPVTAQINIVDDTGATLVNVSNAIYANGSLGTSAQMGVGAGTTTLGGSTASTSVPLPKRLRGQLGAAAGTLTRQRYEARR